MTKELLSIEDVERLRLVFTNHSGKDFSVPIKPLVINGEIYYEKEAVLNLLLKNKLISTKLECFNEKEVRTIIGYEDDSFLPSYKFRDICFWERSRVETYIAQKHPKWKKSDIDQYLEHTLVIDLYLEKTRGKDWDISRDYWRGFSPKMEPVFRT